MKVFEAVIEETKQYTVHVRCECVGHIIREVEAGAATYIDEKLKPIKLADSPKVVRQS